ncbi:hypothetical protein [Acidovorax sp.]|uniref:hypothetical protein n=1 Tax=Acidovorax sp. TaxID=1872122 RepID=UPI003919035E
MAGLLDFNDPGMRMGLGLLALGQMPRNQGFQGLMGLLASQDDSARMKAETALRQEQANRQRQEWEMKDAAAKAQAAQQAAIPSLFTPGQPGGVSGFDVQKALALGMDPKAIQQYAELQNVGRQEVARTVEGVDAQGRPATFQYDKFGQRVGDGVGQWKAPMLINQGDRQTLFDPAARQTIGSLGINMSQAERDASARGWASNNLAQQRLAFDMSGGTEGGGAQAALTRQFGKAPPGYRWKQDGTAEAIPGGPADVKAGLEGEKAKQRAAFATSAADNTLDAVRDAKNLTGRTTAGVGSVLSGVPGTNARDLQAKLETIKANLGFDRLQQMRDMSPTGGALGAVAVQELIALQSTVSSLDQAQSPAQLQQSLNKIEKHYGNWKNAVNGQMPKDPAKPGEIGSGSFGMQPSSGGFKIIGVR